MRKSQSSFEFISIFGIGLVFILILGAIFFNYSSLAQSDLNKKQLDLISSQIMTSIEEIYYLGFGNRVSIKSKFPEGIVNFTIVHKNNSGLEFDYLNVSFYDGDTIVSNLYTPNKGYIRFSCNDCFNSTKNTLGEYTSYYLGSHSSSGLKTIRIENFDTYVSVDFVN